MRPILHASYDLFRDWQKIRARYRGRVQHGGFVRFTLKPANQPVSRHAHRSDVIELLKSLFESGEQIYVTL